MHSDLFSITAAFVPFFRHGVLFSMIRCFIVLPVSERIWQILLLYPAAGIIVGILISLPMSQSGSALIMGIALMLGYLINKRSHSRGGEN